MKQPPLYEEKLAFGYRCFCYTLNTCTLFLRDTYLLCEESCKKKKKHHFDEKETVGWNVFLLERF